MLKSSVSFSTYAPPCFLRNLTAWLDFVMVELLEATFGVGPSYASVEVYVDCWVLSGDRVKACSSASRSASVRGFFPFLVDFCDAVSTLLNRASLPSSFLPLFARFGADASASCSDSEPSLTAEVLRFLADLGGVCTCGELLLVVPSERLSLLATNPVTGASADEGPFALRGADALSCDSPVRAVEKVSDAGSDSASDLCRGRDVSLPGSLVS